MKFLILLFVHVCLCVEQTTSVHRTSSSSSLKAQPSYISSFIVSGTRVYGGSLVSGSITVPTGRYESDLVQQNATSQTTSRNGTRSGTTSATGSVLVGTVRSTSLRNSSTNTIRSTSTSTSISAAPTNTQPCNGWPEFCNRKYSNLTQVCAHNAAFVVPGNAASNQAIPIVGQLNDGIRMIQGETHYYNNTMYSCHTSCDLLNAGPLVDELTTIAQWVEEHPYEVVTILLANNDFVSVENFTEPIMKSGLGPYLYIPPKIPMRLDDWPTLGEMILSHTRVVVFMDYNANQTKVPYILDQYSQMWETPFSPVDPNFPCTQQRPPGLPVSQAKNDLMYLLNQNLNLQLSIAGLTILIPNFAELSRTNADHGYGTGSSLGNTSKRCTADWGRPPNFLVVDFYNYGNFNGSVFEVAARCNNVTYNRKKAHCCGENLQTSLATRVCLPEAVVLVTAIIFAFLCVL